MYNGEDYILFLLALIFAFGFMAVLGAVIERLEDKRAFRESLGRDKEAFELPRRRGKNYVQEWDEVLDSLQGKKSA